MKLLMCIALFFISIFFLISCASKQNNYSEFLRKVNKTSVSNELINVTTDSLKMKNLFNTPNSIDSGFRDDSTFFGYFILNRFNGNCSSDSLQSWRFKAYYQDSIYSKNKCNVYEGDLINSTVKGSSNNFSMSNNFSSPDNFICVRQIVEEDVFEIFYFFKIKKHKIEHNRTLTFGFNH